MRARSAAHALRVAGGDVLLEEVDEAAHRHQRAAQVVGDGVGEALELGVAALQLADEALALGAGGLQPLRHLVERLGHGLQLVPGAHVEPAAEAALGDLARALGEAGEGPGQPAGEGEAEEGGQRGSRPR